MQSASQSDWKELISIFVSDEEFSLGVRQFINGGISEQMELSLWYQVWSRDGGRGGKDLQDKVGWRIGIFGDLDSDGASKDEKDEVWEDILW